MEPLELVFDSAANASAIARRALRWWLEEVQCPKSIKDDVVVVFSELVTNAVRHAGVEFTAAATFDDGRLRLSVTDREPSPPAVLPDAGPSGGFGLRLIEALSDGWGWRPLGVGKEVWAETLC